MQNGIQDGHQTNRRELNVFKSTLNGIFMFSVTDEDTLSLQICIFSEMSLVKRAFNAPKCSLLLVPVGN